MEPVVDVLDFDITTNYCIQKNNQRKLNNVVIFVHLVLKSMYFYEFLTAKKQFDTIILNSNKNKRNLLNQIFAYIITNNFTG